MTKQGKRTVSNRDGNGADEEAAVAVKRATLSPNSRDRSRRAAQAEAEALTGAVANQGQENPGHGNVKASGADASGSQRAQVRQLFAQPAAAAAPPPPPQVARPAEMQPPPAAQHAGAAVEEEEDDLMDLLIATVVERNAELHAQYAHLPNVDMESLPVQHKTRAEIIGPPDGISAGTAAKVVQQQEQQQYYAALLAAQERSVAQQRLEEQQRLEKQKEAEATASRLATQPAEMQPLSAVQLAGLATANEALDLMDHLAARAMEMNAQFLAEHPDNPELEKEMERARNNPQPRTITEDKYEFWAKMNERQS